MKSNSCSAFYSYWNSNNANQISEAVLNSISLIGRITSDRIQLVLHKSMILIKLLTIYSHCYGNIKLIKATFTHKVLKYDNDIRCGSILMLQNITVYISIFVSKIRCIDFDDDKPIISNKTDVIIIIILSNKNINTKYVIIIKDMDMNETPSLLLLDTKQNTNLYENKTNKIQCTVIVSWIITERICKRYTDVWNILIQNRIKNKNNNKNQKKKDNSKSRHNYPIHRAAILYGKSGSGKTMTINLLGLQL